MLYKPSRYICFKYASVYSLRVARGLRFGKDSWLQEDYLQITDFWCPKLYETLGCPSYRNPSGTGVTVCLQSLTYLIGKLKNCVIVVLLHRSP
jgi:hypothetical protein